MLTESIYSPWPPFTPPLSPPKPYLPLNPHPVAEVGSGMRWRRKDEVNLKDDATQFDHKKGVTRGLTLRCVRTAVSLVTGEFHPCSLKVQNQLAKLQAK